MSTWESLPHLICRFFTSLILYLDSSLLLSVYCEYLHILFDIHRLSLHYCLRAAGIANNNNTCTACLESVTMFF